MLLQLVWEMVSELPVDQRRREIIVMGNDTLVESPLVIQHLRDSLADVRAAADNK